MFKTLALFSLTALGLSIQAWAAAPACPANGAILRCLNNPELNQRLEAKVAQVTTAGQSRTYIRIYDIANAVKKRIDPASGLLCPIDNPVQQIQVGSTGSGVQGQRVIYSGATASGTTATLIVDFNEQKCSLKLTGSPDQDKMFLDQDSELAN